ncbi:hypothetical protein [Saccharopolyspora sp. NPDC002376]
MVIMLSGIRAGHEFRTPRFKTKRDRRQAVRFTANARWSITSGRARLRRHPSHGDLDRLTSGGANHN